MEYIMAPKKRICVTPAGKARLMNCANNPDWQGKPNAGTLFAISKQSGVSLSVIQKIDAGLPVGNSTAQKLIDMFGSQSVKVEDVK